MHQALQPNTRFWQIPEGMDNRFDNPFTQEEQRKRRKDLQGNHPVVPSLKVIRKGD